MTQTLRILGALLVKNNRQPGVLVSGMMVVAMLGLTVLNGVHRLPNEAWIFVMAWLLVLGTSAGLGAFSVDLKANNIRFLEYLPIRRWHIWAANWFDALAWLLLALLCATLLPTIQWHPDWMLDDGDIDSLGYALFATRWSLMLGCGGVLFCAFGVAAFCRLAYLRDNIAMVRGILTAMLVTSAVWLVPIVFGITPNLRDAAVPLIINGLLFSLLSFAIFMLTPREWGSVRSLLFIRLPAIVFGTATAFGIVVVFAYVWRLPDDLRPQSLDVVRSPDGLPTILLTTDSIRSGGHLYAIPASLGAPRYIGRGLMPARRDPRPVRELILRGTFDLNNFLPSPGRLVISDLDGRNERTIFAGMGLRRFTEETPFDVMGVCGDFIIAGERNGRSRETLLILNHDGSIVDRVRDASPACMPGETKLLAPIQNSDDPPGAGGFAYLLYDPITRSRMQLSLPGTVIAYPPDLSAVLCLCTKSSGKETRQSLVVVSLPSQKKREVLGFDDLPPVPKHYYDLATPSDPVSVQSSAIQEDGFSLLVDDSFEHALVHSNQNADEQSRETLLDVNLQTGARTKLRDGAPSVIGGLLRFSADKRAVLYRSGSRIYRLSIPSGESMLIANVPSDFSSIHIEISPDGDRVLADCSDYEPPKHPPLMQIWEHGRVCFSRSMDDESAKWLDNNRIVWIDGECAYICNFDGSGKRQIFPAK
jgi:hypothetical protein